MLSFDEFQQHLHNLLAHLYDPIYQPPAALLQMLGAPPYAGLATIQSAAKTAIAHLAPASDTPPGARSRRLYDLLSYRYVQELTQEETAHRLGITPRHLRREQQQAIHALAQQLWDAWHSAQATRLGQQQPLVDPLDSPPATDEASSWRNQVHQEVALLQQSAPGAVADIMATFAGVIKVGEPLALRHDIRLRVETAPPLSAQPPPRLTAAIHPSVLRQILLTALEKLCQRMATGEIVLRSAVKEQLVEITVLGTPIPAPEPLTTDLMAELATAYQGRVTCQAAADHLCFHIWLPLAGKVTVLVIDDNDDLVHFYRRYTALTRYELVQVAQGQQAVAMAKALQPAAIILDVMLPDLDGWELLAALHEDPATRAIPVIVCSVVQRAELASALGAAHYLVKPVGRLELLHTLEKACFPVATRGWPGSAHWITSGAPTGHDLNQP